MHHDITPERISQLIAIRDTIPGAASVPQRQRLLEAMRQLGHVTTFEASRFLDIYHPPARKRELVEEDHQIITLMRNVFTESGKRHRVGLYALDRCLAVASTESQEKQHDGGQPERKGGDDHEA